MVGTLAFWRILFVLANAMDVACSHILFSTGYAYEANPAARYFIEHWGLVGMATYKAVFVAFVIGVICIIKSYRASTATRTMCFGTLLVGTVVAYSLTLLASYGLGA